MHLVLTDRIFCPRCGPEYGLVLLAHDVRDRRVLDGDLGCPNCRETFPVREGFADLRLTPRDPLPPARPTGESDSLDPAETVRLGALLGVTEGPGTLLLRGLAGVYGGALAELIGDIEVVALGEELKGMGERRGLSRMISPATLPFMAGTFKGVLLSGTVLERDLDEALRMVVPSGRVVMLNAPEDSAAWARNRGAKVILTEEGVLVMEREKDPPLPLVTLRGV